MISHVQTVDSARPSLSRTQSSVSEFCITTAPRMSKPRLDMRAISNLETSAEVGPADDLINDNASVVSEDLIFDVLPSFQMYNTLHKHIPTGDISEPVQELPPDYGEESMEPTRSSSVDESGEILDVEKVYNLPKVVTPIEIELHITKTAGKPNQHAPAESLLREYTIGDFIHGYFIVKNKSDTIIPFEMFYVTLEGYTCIIDKNTKRKTIKRFLRSVDFSASWSDGAIVSASGIHYWGDILDNDNCQLGFRNDRLLHPGGKYKKFFTFRFPGQLLDCMCSHQKHVCIPPSFGLDRDKGCGKYSTIEVNPMLGYGNLGTKGSPILTVDHAGHDISISYTIDVRLVGKDLANGKQLCLLKDREYNLRFVPFGCEESVKSTEKQLKEFSQRVEERLTILERFLDKFERGERLSIRDTRQSTNKQVVTDEELRRPDRKQGKHSKSTMYDEDHIVSVHNPYSIIQKKKKLFGSSVVHSNKTGVLSMRAQISELPLSYHAPNLMRNANSLENVADKKNAANLKALQKESQAKLKSVVIHLECTPTVGCIPHDPPLVKNVSLQLVCATYSSLKSVPLTMDPAFMADLSNLKRLNDTFGRQFERLESAKSRFDLEHVNVAMLDGLVRVEDFLDKQMQSDIESLKLLKIMTEVLPRSFEKPIIDNREWIKNDKSWVNAMDVGLTWEKLLTANVVPSFQSCLIGRGYLVRVSVEFEGVEDTCVLDIPVSVARTA